MIKPHRTSHIILNGVLITALTLIIGCLNLPVVRAEESTRETTLAFPDEPPGEPANYRMKDYRSPVPQTLNGAKVLTEKQAYQIWQDKSAVFVDVMPQAPKPPNLPKDMLFRVKPRHTIPGSLWLANVGYGRLTKEMTTHFKTNLNKLTKGNKQKSLVFFCQKDCWMSWNAAKRALSWGYSQVSWFPDGLDGWQRLKGPLEKQKPVPLKQSVHRKLSH